MDVSVLSVLIACAIVIAYGAIGIDVAKKAEAGQSISVVEAKPLKYVSIVALILGVGGALYAGHQLMTAHSAGQDYRQVKLSL